MNPHYPLVTERAGHRCEYCHAPEAMFNVEFEVEHIVPTSRSGEDIEANWALACRACNLSKSDHLDATDPETGVTVSLFHPRRDGWEEHFRVDEKTGSIMGLTAVGRATVDRLKMNAPLQMTARQQWMRLGLFP